MAEKELELTEEIFCQEYLANGLNGMLAYQKAYPNATLDSCKASAARLLTRVNVKARIDELKKDRIKALRIDKNYVLKRLIEIDELDVAELFDDEWQLLPILKWPKAWRTSISGLDVQSVKAGDVESVIKKLKFPDKVKNLELIGKHVNVKAWDKEKEIEDVDALANALKEAIKCLPN